MKYIRKHKPSLEEAWQFDINKENEEPLAVHIKNQLISNIQQVDTISLECNLGSSQFHYPLSKNELSKLLTAIPGQIIERYVSETLKLQDTRILDGMYIGTYVDGDKKIEVEIKAYKDSISGFERLFTTNEYNYIFGPENKNCYLIVLQYSLIQDGDYYTGYKLSSDRVNVISKKFLVNRKKDYERVKQERLKKKELEKKDKETSN